jgi:hypothetical protein
MTTSIEILETHILSGDRESVKSTLSAILEQLVTDESLAMEITTPAAITSLHTKLIESLGVNPRLLRVNGKAIINRRRRALMFTQAMLNGVNYLK